ncbi:MAG: radical SAM family heme chaperone HemW, partial [Bacteroidota bacterium]
RPLGLYLHVPFCRKACHYCNFHFSTSLKHVDVLIDALIAEIHHRASQLEDATITSIYWGGGTPSLLSRDQLGRVYTALREHIYIDPQIEQTIELNPEDVSEEYLMELWTLGLNRLSVGIQSFDQRDLEAMNRAHNVDQSHRAIEMIGESSFDEFTIDLMFGLVDSSLADWEANLDAVRRYKPPHLSCYNLTIEEQTAYHKWATSGRIRTPDEDTQYEQFMLAHRTLGDIGYSHYEVSNYAQEGHEARHNTSYWRRQDYLGFGPSAHSLQGNLRSWNVSDNMKYIRAIEADHVYQTTEILTSAEEYNEWVMLGLRTADGVSEELIRSLSVDIYDHFQTCIQAPIRDALLIRDKGYYRIPTEHWYLSDHVASQLFLTTDN